MCLVEEEITMSGMRVFREKKENKSKSKKLMPNMFVITLRFSRNGGKKVSARVARKTTSAQKTTTTTTTTTTKTTTTTTATTATTTTTTTTTANNAERTHFSLFTKSLLQNYKYLQKELFNGNISSLIKDYARQTDRQTDSRQTDRGRLTDRKGTKTSTFF